ncbi:hypothetical protein [Sorangium sp. So ce426]|uniref:hypothetical protein n=1 Tax=Sorangium sp. So ce426 TaxID=3133312 RepID=UPI003F5B11C9
MRSPRPVATRGSSAPTKPAARTGNRAAAPQAAVSDRVRALATKVDSLDRKITTLDDRAERAHLLSTRPDFSPEVLATLQKAPIASVRDAVKTWPKGPAKNDVRASLLPPEEKRAMDERMGLAKPTQAIRREGNKVVFGVLTAEDARKALAAQGRRGRTV